MSDYLIAFGAILAGGCLISLISYTLLQCSLGKKK